MAAKKSAKKRAARSGGKRSGGKKSAKKVAKKSVARRSPASPARAAAPAPADRRGVITHTELASTDPAATRDWCAQVLGWEFGDAVPTPTGPYHMWRFRIGTGGGIRANNPPESPGSIPYCEVDDIHETYDRALDAGASAMLEPQQLPGGMGWIAIVAAPGGVPIGFWSMK